MQTTCLFWDTVRQVKLVDQEFVSKKNLQVMKAFDRMLVGLVKVAPFFIGAKVVSEVLVVVSGFIRLLVYDEAKKQHSPKPFCNPTFDNFIV